MYVVYPQNELQNFVLLLLGKVWFVFRESVFCHKMLLQLNLSPAFVYVNDLKEWGKYLSE